MKAAARCLSGERGLAQFEVASELAAACAQQRLVPSTLARAFEGNHAACC